MNIILLELILVLVVALGLGFWQLYDVNKALKEHSDDDPSEDARHRQAPSEGGHEAGRDDSEP
ncbi:MAG: hypothetical protein GVY32_07025 [Gammaproteobacteria bacterium]|jgi:hypothetical protein|nr:hypothetical protein [Gammaproteobacteria bacterium]